MKRKEKMKRLNTRTLVSKTFAVSSVLMLSLLAHTLAVANGDISRNSGKNKMEVCHLNWKGEYQLLNLREHRALGHLMHHEADIEPVNGECVEEVTYEIGDTGPGGGVIFYIDEDHYVAYEAAPEDQVISEWCSADAASVNIPGIREFTDPINRGPDFENGTPDNIDYGNTNTPQITSICGNATAAGAAQNYVWPSGQTDGFLPSKWELSLLYFQKDKIGGFNSPFYWSSSEYNDSGAWRQSFTNGSVGADDKYDGLGNGVRAVRQFPYVHDYTL